MQIRQAKSEEFISVRNFYWNLIEQMAGRENTIGWKIGIYPSDDFLSDSIRKSELYVLDSENGYSACVIVNSSCNEGYNGCLWKVNCASNEILVPHALAVSPNVQGKGIGKLVVQDIIEMAKASGKKSVRLDVLGGNIAAERLYTKMGFEYIQSKTMFYEDTGWTEYVVYELVL